MGTDKKHILVVEDDIIATKVAKALFEALGCEVDLVNNGKEALNLAITNHTYNGIYMDIGLPLMNGVDVCKAIRQFEAEHTDLIPVTIVAVTANGNPEEIAQYKQVGMQDVIIKPFNKEKALEFLEKIH